MQWEIQHELPVNVDILLLIGLPPEPFAFHVRVGVVFVEPGQKITSKLKLVGVIKWHRRFTHISLVPVKILNQSLYYFSFRVSDLLNETQVTPRKNLGSKSRKNKDPSAVRFVQLSIQVFLQTHSTFRRIPITFLLFALDSPKLWILKAQILRDDVTSSKHRPTTNSSPAVLIVLCKHKESLQEPHLSRFKVRYRNLQPLTFSAFVTGRLISGQQRAISSVTTGTYR